MYELRATSGTAVLPAGSRLPVLVHRTAWRARSPVSSYRPGSSPRRSSAMPSATRAADLQAQSTPPRQATPVLSTRPLQTPIPSTRPVDPAPLTRIPASALRAHPAPQCLSATAVSPMPPPVPCMPRPHCGVDHVLTGPIFAEFLESKSPRKHHCFQGLVLVAGVGFEPTTFRL